MLPAEFIPVAKPLVEHAFTGRYDFERIEEQSFISFRLVIGVERLQVFKRNRR